MLFIVDVVSGGGLKKGRAGVYVLFLLSGEFCLFAGGGFVTVERGRCFQDRNLKHPNGGPQASRMTAAARRKIGSLGTAIESLESLLKASTDV